MISIIVPTFNEYNNVTQLIEGLVNAMKDFQFEILIVDDESKDGTAELASDLLRKYHCGRVIERSGKTPGLSRSVIEGIAKAKGDIVGFMDADLSHPVEIVPRLVQPIIENKCELAIASRYIPGGGTYNWPFRRQFVSKVACTLASHLTKVKDLTSGCMFFKKDILKNVSINPIGFKIGLEVIVRGKYNRFLEIPYVFKDREFGQSKMGFKQIFSYLIQILSLTVHL